MPNILKRDAKLIRTVFRKALGRGAGNTVVNFQAAGGVLSIHCVTPNIGIGWHLCGNWADDRFALPLNAFNDIKGRRDDGIEFDNHGEQVIVRWNDGSTPRVVEYDAFDAVDSLPVPGDLASNEGRIICDMADAVQTSDTGNTRYALGCVRMRGSDGQLAATDGRQALICDGHKLPWEDAVLTKATPVFGLKELQRQDHVEVGKLDDHVFFQAGPWRVWTRIVKEGRFPRVDDNLTAVSAASSTVTLDDSDAEFLDANVAKLPGGKAYNAPVTVDLNGSIAVRAKEPDEDAVTELILSNSQRDGEDVCFQTNREYLSRAAKLGLRHFYFHGPESPAIARDGHRQYVWTLLCGKGAIEPCDAANRITSQTKRSAKVKPVQAEHTPERKTETKMPQTNNKGAVSKAKTNSDVEPRAENSITAAEALRDQLRDAAGQTNQLVRLLKKRRKESKLVASTLETLRRLEPVEG